MKILLYGSNGWIGSMMLNILRSHGHTTITGDARLDNYIELQNEILRVDPDAIFSSTGKTHGTDETGKKWSTIDYLELPGKLSENIRDNLRGPMNLAKICCDYNIHLTYMGTGCIFEFDQVHQMPTSDNKNVKGFTEEDHPNFTGSGYSTVKGQTDLLMRTYSEQVLNCPITDEDNSRNFITKITNYEKICSIPNSMTVLGEILPIIAHMISTRTTGTFNMTNPGYITHNEILDKNIELIDGEFTYNNFTPEEQSQILLSGRSNNYLDTTKLQDYCSKYELTLNNIHDAVNKALLNYKI
jgi:3,5-epimerase/4-reductase